MAGVGVEGACRPMEKDSTREGVGGCFSGTLWVTKAAKSLLIGRQGGF